MPDVLAVALNVTDAMVLSQSKEVQKTALSFAPDASELLRDHGFEVLELEDLVSSCTHARNLVRCNHILSHIEERLLRTRSHKSDVESIRIFTFNFLPALLLFRSALNSTSASQFVVVENSKIAKFDRDGEILRHFALLSASRFDALLPSTTYSSAHAHLAMFLNRLIGRALGRRYRILQLDRSTPFTRRVASEIIGSRSDAVLLSVGHPGKTMLATLRRAIKSFGNAVFSNDPTKEIRVFRATTHAKSSSLACLPSTLIENDAPLNEVLTLVFSTFLPRILKDGTAGAEFAAREKADILVLDHLIQPSVIRAANDLTTQGVSALMINHGTDTAQNTAMSSLGAKFWARHGRTNPPDGADIFCKSPLTEELVPLVTAHPANAHAIEVGKRSPYNPRKPQDPFLIVLAGNYRIIEEHVPWVVETPGEFLRGTMEFAKAAAQIDNVKLIIKLKPKKTGLSADRLAEIFSAEAFEGRVQVDTATPLSSLFERMGLLVGNNSATLQEALDNGIPLFLNTWRRRYCHFPAQTTPPTSDQRAPVYAVRHADELVPMLTAIRDRHQERLTGGETKGLSWQPDDIERTNEFLARALDPARR